MRTYAAALYRAAAEASAEDQVLKDVREVTRALCENRAYVRLLNAPNLTLGVRYALIDEAFFGAHPYVRNLLKMLAEHSECDLFCTVAEAYIELHRQNSANVQARLILPTEIDDALKRSIENALRAKLRMCPEIQTEIDPQLIGGARLEINGKIWDGSLRTKLARIGDFARRQGLED